LSITGIIEMDLIYHDMQILKEICRLLIKALNTQDNLV